MKHIDLALVTAAREGDICAIERLIDESQTSITRFARKYCTTAEDVEDAVQQTLWLIYRKIQSLRSASAYVSWAFQIVRNACYQLISDAHRIGETCEIEMLDFADFTLNPELTAALKSDIVGAIARLPASYRQILIMRDVQGYSAPEVADQLNITLETVKSRLHRARGLLRDALGNWSA